MTSRIRGGLAVGCVAAVAFMAGRAGAREPPPGSAAEEVSPAPPAWQPSPSSPPPPYGHPPRPFYLPGSPWQPGRGGTRPTRAERRVWYGWQHLIVFGVSAALIPIAVGIESPVLGFVSFGGFAIGGPIVHWSHGNVGKGFGSFGINVGCAMLFGNVAILVAPKGEGHIHDVIMGLLGGSAAGLITANLIDVAALAYDKVEPQGHASFPRLVPQVRFAPGVATVGLGGSF